MNFKEMSLVDFERLLISKINEVREASGNKITRRAINAVLGVDENDFETVEEIRKKLKSSACFRARGRYYTFLIEEVIDQDEELIASDPDMSMMARVIKVAGKDITSKVMHPVAPPRLVKRCKHCQHWSRDDKKCKTKGETRLGIDNACTDESFLFNPVSIARRKK